ncbi:ABC transporter substrate-binding protein [Bradyrhizobium manausense]|uniref:ABC transporter substrate-binding protein n=1 Tax=Bradyrhizobium manausense TaxID=989370 RepID=UPI001BA652F5|nr:ABC transporter substrate-binding protein [Bradyrhizobium manausense]MBR0687812.1 ABC transporter substrate-binding protein [Bradyrhizobium manausense]
MSIDTTKQSGRISRRTVLKAMGAAATTFSIPTVTRADAAGTIRIGFVSPTTGPLGVFGDADAFTLERIRALLGKGLENHGKTYNIEIIARDSQSDPNKASEFAGDLILNKGVHLMVPASTSDVINPVSDQCELNGVPSISSTAPWQSFVFPRGGSSDKPFAWTYHFFWGLEDALGTFVGLWNSLQTNKKVGMLFPSNTDGEAWGNRDYGLPPAVEKAGYTTVVPNKFQPRTNDFSAQIALYKQAGVDIVGGITTPTDLKTFITQCRQQNFTPKVVTVAAALLFPSGIEALGSLGEGMSTEVWWTPAFSFRSSLTGQNSAEIAAEWEAKTGKQWIQPLGYTHALWEVIIDILKRAENPLDRTSIRDAMKATKIQTLVGPVDFSSGPHPNISKTPIFGGQWVKGAKYPFDLKIVDNSLSKLVPTDGKLQPLHW